MSPLRLFCSHSEIRGEGCVEYILARSWYMTYGPLPHVKFDELEWLSLILSDNKKLCAAVLHAEYCHRRSPIQENPAALKALQHQYNKIQYSVTPISRLPMEILTEIFYISHGIGVLSTGLMLVCRKWYQIIDNTSNLWTSLVLGAGTSPEKVGQALLRARTSLLSVEINIDGVKNMIEEFHSPLTRVSEKASQWETLTVTSLPHSEPEIQYIVNILSMYLRPMKQLKHLKIMQSAFSPPFNLLLENIAIAAIGSLASMEIDNSSAIICFLQPSHASIFSSLTTFKAQVPKMSHPVDLLPHFLHLEVLHLTNVLLPIYENGSPLPLAHSLHHLYLKAVSIQWMGGQAFRKIESCVIIAPVNGLPLHCDAHLLVCGELHLENWNVSSIGQFSAPSLDSLIIKSNVWSPDRGNEQMSQLCRAGLGAVFQPRTLSLTITCKGRVLLAALQSLTALEELRIDLPRPSALGKHFFLALLAKPTGQVGQKHLHGLMGGKRGRFLLCPCLRVLELKYHRWLRNSDCLHFLAPLFAICWSREQIGAPLKLGLQFKSYQGTWKSLELSSQSTMIHFQLEIPLNMQSDQALSFDLLEHCFNSVTHLPLVVSTRQSKLYWTPLFTICCYHLWALRIKGQGESLNVLPSCEMVKELSLNNIKIPPYTHLVDLPLVHTLRNLSLRKSTLHWMDGQTFAQLKRFEVDECGWPETFEHEVQMPVCTHVIFHDNDLKVLPLLQSKFKLPPLLDTWRLTGLWKQHPYARAISALQRIQAKAFHLKIHGKYRSLPEFLETKDEVEQLTFQMHPLSMLDFARFSTINASTKAIPCPNMKVLNLQWTSMSHMTRDLVIQWCEQMIDERRLAGHPMERCCIWWDLDNWTKPASLVLVNEKWGGQN